MAANRVTVSVSQIQPGRVLAENALKGQAIIAHKGTTLTMTTIKKLQEWNVPSVTIFLKPGEAVYIPNVVAPVATSTVDPIVSSVVDLPLLEYETVDPAKLVKPEDLQKSEMVKPAEINESDGLMHFRGDVGLGHGNIETANALQIDGDIHCGITITARGNITIQGNVFGSRIVSAGSITAKTARQAIFIADKTIELEHAFTSIISAKEEVKVTTGGGTIIGGRIICGGRITAKRVGNINKQPTELVVTNELPKIRYQQLLALEQTIKTLMVEVRQLKKVIDLIQTLGQKITSLPDVKKVQLKQQSDLFFVKKKEFEDSLRLKTQIEQEMEEWGTSDDCPVRVLEMGFGGVKVTIEDATFNLDKLTNNFGFYKKKMVLLRLFH